MKLSTRRNLPLRASSPHMQAQQFRRIEAGHATASSTPVREVSGTLSRVAPARLVTFLVLCMLVTAACNGSSQPTEISEESTAVSAEPTVIAAEPTTVSEEPVAGQAAALEPAARNGMYDAAPDMTIDPDRQYHALFNTEQGQIRVRLFADSAPVTVNNFVFLARDGFYNGTYFHRVLADFMAQGGDPSGSGAGGPGYQFQDEFESGLQFDRAGLLAMANAGPNTNGSQFFITFTATPWLDGNHTIFGEVVEGMDVLFSLSLRDPMAAGASEFPGELLESVEIEEADAQ